MALTLVDLTAELRGARSHFLKHLRGLTDEQWTWKPYPECKSILETVVHLVTDDRAALQSLQASGEPEYETLSNQAEEEARGDRERALGMLEGSHTALLTWIEAQYANATLDQEVSIFGGKKKLAPGLLFLISEDYYHAGQVAFARLATEPSWDYYGSVYGPEG